MKHSKFRILLILLALLAAVVVITLIIDHSKGERNFRDKLFTIDTSAVSSITVYPKGNSNGSYKLIRKGKKWEVVSPLKKTHPADSAAVRNILDALSGVMPEGVAATGPSGWKDLQITDSATRVVVEQGNTAVADFRLGKMSFAQNRNTRGSGGQMIIKSHIRVAGDDRVYTVDGWLSVMFGEDADQLRNHFLARTERNRLMKLTFEYPGDSSFVLFKEGNAWTVNGKPADSAAMAGFLNTISNVRGTQFAQDGITLPFFGYSLVMEGEGLIPVKIYGAMDPLTGKQYLRSPNNPAEVFESPVAANSLFSQLFPPMKHFLPQPGKKEKKR